MASDSASTAKTKICHTCWAILPIAYYGAYRNAPDGKAFICKLCVSQAKTIRHERVFGYRNPKPPPEIILNVMHHNEATIKQAISLKASIVGFNPHTHKGFRVDFSNTQYGLPSVAIYADDGSFYKELVYSSNDLEITIGQLLEIFRSERIRLEWSQGHVIASKNVVYFMKASS